MITSEIRNQYYEHSSDVQRFLYSHPKAGSILNKISNNNYFSHEKKSIFVLTVGDIILGFYKIEDTVPLLQQELGLDPATAAALGAEVLDFLAPLSDPNWEPPVEDSDEESEEVSNPPINIPVKSPALYTTPVPLHTLASDMDVVRNGVAVTENQPTYSAIAPHEPVAYRSTQPSRQPLEDIPTYTPTPTQITETITPAAPDRPRWSSDI
ncbi:MAG: hypothetical protein RLZZ70_588 [Candidatus Parcubacteria bacterium]|jgi:hypothetical protein